MAKNQTDLFTVNLIRYTLPLNTKLFCGKLTKEEVCEFMKNITSLKIPVDSCVYKVSVDANRKYRFMPIWIMKAAACSETTVQMPQWTFHCP